MVAEDGHAGCFDTFRRAELLNNRIYRAVAEDGHAGCFDTFRRAELLNNRVISNGG